MHRFMNNLVNYFGFDIIENVDAMIQYWLGYMTHKIML
jgi:hypothetical protein